MSPKPSKLLFLFTLVSGTILSVSSSSWLGAWMGLEINLLSFIPLISKGSNQRSTEASLKYFIIQAIGSVTIITTSMVSAANSSIFFSWALTSPLILALILKAGAAPVHFWFPGVMEGLKWNNCMVLMTWQSIAPLMLISHVNASEILLASAMLSGIAGAVGGLNQTLLRKMMAYSSIGHMGWMLAAMETSETFWLTYMIIYSALSITVASIFNKSNSFHIAQHFQSMKGSTNQKFLLMTNLLSLGGLPPFLGFFPKWMAMQAILVNSPLTALILILSALVNLFYYLRITFSAFLATHFTQKWHTKTNKQSKMMAESAMTTVSLVGMVLIPLFWPY